ncbi:hypothetical protein H4582DRAFT_1032300 [Lactarius indigo]|nr:hypothetical protein H4582DRAFT_1032300 [Lactarius indigo]
MQTLIYSMAAKSDRQHYYLFIYIHFIPGSIIPTLARPPLVRGMTHTPSRGTPGTRCAIATRGPPTSEAQESYHEPRRGAEWHFHRCTKASESIGLNRLSRGRLPFRTLSPFLSTIQAYLAHPSVPGRGYGYYRPGPTMPLTKLWSPASSALTATKYICICH